MLIARITGTMFATRKSARFEGQKMLIVREETPDGRPVGPTFLALDRVDAGMGDRVLINREGSGARLIFADDEIPVQAVVVAVIDDLELQGAQDVELDTRNA